MSKKRPSAILEMLYPKHSREYLEYRSNIQRHMKPAYIEHLARQISNGLWIVSNDMICFDTSGHLINGQNRLAAGVVAGKPFEVFVARNMDPKAYLVMDQGWARTNGAILGMEGRKNAALVAAAGKLTWMWEVHGKPDVPRIKVYPQEVEKALGAYPLIAEKATEASRISGKKCGVYAPGSIILFCMHLFSQAGKRRSEEFFDILAEGNAPTRDHPITALRNRLSNEKIANRRWTVNQRVDLFIKAWNHFYAGTRARTLTISDANAKVRTVKGLGKNQANRGKRTVEWGWVPSAAGEKKLVKILEEAKNQDRESVARLKQEWEDRNAG